MAAQLSLDVEYTEPGSDTTEVDIAEAVLQAHGGDAKTAILSLLADADFLRDQLWIASSLMSKGIGRGWKPRYERV